jgi:hypothetical protein
LRSYHEAISLDVDRAGQLEARIGWLEEGVALKTMRATPSKEEMERYVGWYGPRHIELEAGQLFYRREGSTGRSQLIPLGTHVFGLEGQHEFRIRFAFDEGGHPTKIIGLYANGETDETPRSSP